MVRVLFVSHSKRGVFYYNDASARYRCVFPAEHLNSMGIACDVVHFKQLTRLNMTDYRHIIFHRPQYSLKLKFYLLRIRYLGITAIVDFDDLLFTPKLANQSAAVQAGYMNVRLAKKHANAYHKALNLFKHAWVSTKPLADQLQISHPTIMTTICRNQLPKRWSNLQTPVPWHERLKNKVIRYMPGTSHHKHDFEKVEKVLIELLENNPDIKLEVVGDLTFNIDRFPTGQISQQKHMTFEQLPNVIRSSWLTLAPLQDNIFNQCKSGLKFWESGLYGVPVISSPLHDIERYKNAGLYLSQNPSDWINYIEKMKESSAYQKASDEAYQYAQQAVFSKEGIDERLTSLKIKRLKHNNVNKENTDSDTQLIMCAKYGPRWPAISLDPSNANKRTVNASLEDINNIISNLTKSTKKDLREQGLDNIRQDSPPKKHTIIRKVKKLWYSPHEFFRDIKLR